MQVNADDIDLSCEIQYVSIMCKNTMDKTVFTDSGAPETLASKLLEHTIKEQIIT